MLWGWQGRYAMLSRLCAGSASEFCLQSMHPAASGSCCTGMSSRHACTTSIKVKALAPSTQASPDPYLPKVGNAFGVAILLGTSILVLARNAGLYSSIAAPRACTSADAAASDSTSVSGQCLSRSVRCTGSRGSIVNIASISSFIAQPEFVPYNSSKGAVLQLGRSAL